MKILWHSNAPFVGSGYGTQTELFTRLAAAAGHTVVASAFYGLRGVALNIGLVKVLPGGQDGWGNDVFGAHYAVEKPDVAVALMDAWVVEPPVFARVPVTGWFPVDHDPVPPLVQERMTLAKNVWAMSRFAEREMTRVGLTPQYVPHGFDGAVFRPGDRAAARRAWKVGEETFFAVCVGANKGFPSRKSLDRLIKAWGRFVQTRPDALLYLHCHPFDANGGLELERVAQLYGVPANTIRLADPYRLLRGAFDAAAMAALYTAADALVLPSAGGGFEIPLIEAQACGCPVVTTRCTAMAELVGPGYGIEIDPFDDMALTLQYSEQANVRPSAILAGLEWAYAKRGDESLRAACVDFASQYEGRRVWREWMLPALEIAAGGEQLRQQRDQRTAARLALRDVVTSPEPSAEGLPDGLPA